MAALNKKRCTYPLARHAPWLASAVSWRLAWADALQDRTRCREGRSCSSRESQAERVTFHLPFYMPYDDAHLDFVEFIPALNHLSKFSRWPRNIKSPGTR